MAVRCIDGELGFNRLFEIAPLGLAILDMDLRYVCCNAEFARINGVAAETYVGRSIREISPDIAEKLEAPFRSVFATGSPVRDLKVSGSTCQEPLVQNSWGLSAFPIPDDDGVIRHILASVRENTALEEAERAVNESDLMMHAWQRLNPDPFAILRAERNGSGKIVDFKWEYANPAAERLVGTGALVGRSLLKLFPGHQEFPTGFHRYVRQLNRSKPHVLEEYYEDGHIAGWFRNAAVAIDEDRLAISIQDITAQKEAEAQLSLVSGESRHRFNNMLSIVSSLVLEAAKEAADVKQMSERLLEQVRAMGAAQDLLSQSTANVSLREISEAALAPFASAKLHLTGGPPVSVKAKGVVQLALALNELATNAIKYGGLSTEGRGVELSWTKKQSKVTLCWREHRELDGHEIARRGFGSYLLKAAARSLPNGKIQQEFDSQGLIVSLTFKCETGRDVAG